MTLYKPRWMRDKELHTEGNHFTVEVLAHIQLDNYMRIFAVQIFKNNSAHVLQ